MIDSLLAQISHHCQLCSHPPQYQVLEQIASSLTHQEVPEIHQFHLERNMTLRYRAFLHQQGNTETRLLPT